MRPNARRHKGEKQCATACKITSRTRSCDAPSVTANSVSSGTIRGEPRFAPGSASIASELAARVTAIGWVGSKSRSTNCPKTARGRHDAPDLTTRQRIFEDSADFAPHRQNYD